MKTKRMLALLLAVMMTAAMISGCKNTTNTSAQEDNAPNQTETTEILGGERKAQDVMAELTADDIADSDLKEVSSEDLAAALNEAAQTVKAEGDLPFDMNDSWWSASVTLKTADETEDTTLLLNAGQTENLITVWYRSGEYEHRAQVEGEKLYILLQNHYPGEEEVDETAWKICQPLLEPVMKESLTALQETDAGQENKANYTDYKLVELTKKAQYTDLIEGKTVTVYEFDYAMIMEHPEHMLWAGGTYMDGLKRMRGFDEKKYLVISDDESGSFDYAFFGWDLYAGDDDSHSDQHGRDMILETFSVKK